MFKLRFHNVFKNQKLYLEGVSYFYLNNDDSFSPSHEKPLSIFEKKEIITTFRYYLEKDRDKAIAIALYSKNNRDIIKISCDKNELYILFAAMLSRNHTDGLLHFFNVSLTKPKKYFEIFGNDSIELSELLPSITIPVYRLYGSGSYGHVYSKDGTSNLYKFTAASDSFISELMSTLFLTMTENQNVVTASSSSVHLHEQKLKTLYRCSSTLIMNRYRSLTTLIECLIDQIRWLTEYSYMHLDITPNNVMWDEHEERLKIIDFSGTIGDDSFFNLGERHDKLCTSNSRPDEYGSKRTMSKRNESSELFSMFYTIHELIDNSDNFSSYLPKNKIDKVMKKFANEGVNDLYLSIGKLEQDKRPLLSKLIEKSAEDKEEITKAPFDKIFSKILHDSTLRRISYYFNQWKPLFESIELPHDGERRKFREEVLNLWLEAIPIYNLFRAIHLFDFVRNKVKHLSVKILAKVILYICCSLSKIYVPLISHSENHPVYQVLREIVLVPTCTSLLLTPLTAYLLMYIDNYYEDKEQHWFKCLYSRNYLKRNFDEEKDIINFTNFYFLETCKTATIDPYVLFEKYGSVKDKIYTCKSIVKQVKIWLCS